MKSMRFIFFLVFLNTLNIFGRPKTDVLVMNNGDRFTCEVKKLEMGVLYASFDYVDGTVSIQWSKVSHLESNQMFIVHTQDGSVYEGTLRTPETPASQPVKLEVIEFPENATEMDRAIVVEIVQTSQSFWKRLSGNIDSGLIYTKGNNTTQYNIGADLRLRRDLWSGDASFTSTLSTSSGVKASTHNQARLKALRRVGNKRWFYSGATDFLQSSQQGINRQTTLGGGVGIFLKDTNNARIAVSAGLAWQGTKYESLIGSQSRPNALAGMFIGDLHLFKFKKTSIDITASALPVLTEIGRLRTSVNTAYSIEIISNLWFKISFYGNWDNRPPATFSGSDYGTTSSISWSFN